MGETIEALLDPSKATADILRFIQTLYGFGPFAAANVVTLLGRLDSQPFDSETVRHMREFHGVDPLFHKTSAAMLELARRHYSADKYGRWQFLVYWFEYWLSEERAIEKAVLQHSRHATQPSSIETASVPIAATVPQDRRKHWQLVAAQTKKRKQRSVIKPRTKRQHSPAARTLALRDCTLSDTTDTDDLGIMPARDTQLTGTGARNRPVASGTAPLFPESTRVTRSRVAQMTASAQLGSNESA